METNTSKNIVIDATDTSCGRLATKVATCLRGKHLPEFTPVSDLGCLVTVENISKMKFTGKKLADKIYYHHSGYPGGLKAESLSEVIDKHGYEEALKRAVWNMLPKNKLRKEMLKRLTIK